MDFGLSSQQLELRGSVADEDMVLMLEEIAKAHPTAAGAAA